MAASIPLITVEGIKWVNPPNLNTPSNTWSNPANSYRQKEYFNASQVRNSRRTDGGKARSRPAYADM